MKTIPLVDEKGSQDKNSTNKADLKGKENNEQAPVGGKILENEGNVKNTAQSTQAAGINSNNVNNNSKHIVKARQ